MQIGELLLLLALLEGPTPQPNVVRAHGGLVTRHQFDYMRQGSGHKEPW